ncbi:nucleotidyltransferase family protein [Halopseudomonas sp.]|uniref:nucleotidyltransferase family protein n=1 Tax=Halopseudomonas sp. TaxID=2901191 RepID=UPI0030037D15
MTAPAVPLVALMLAAGSARRFGSDKRLARLADGRSLLSASLDNARNAYLDVRVVLRPQDDAAALGVPAQCPIIRSERCHEGMAQSLVAGVAALQAIDAEAVAVLLGDMPRIRPQTLIALQAQATARRIVVPTHAGQRGHPVLFGRAFWPELLLLQGDRGARELLRQHAKSLLEVPVTDPGILLDIDDAKMLAALPAD